MDKLRTIFENPRSTAKLGGAFTLMVAVSVAMCCAGYTCAKQVILFNSETQGLFSHDLTGISAIKEAAIFQVKSTRVLRDVLLANGKQQDIADLAQTLYEFQISVKENLDDASGVMVDSSSQEKIAEIRAQLPIFYQDSEIVVRTAQAGNIAGAKAALKQANAVANAINLSIAEVCRMREDAARGSHLRTVATYQKLRSTLLYLSLGVVILGIICGVMTTRSVRRGADLRYRSMFDDALIGIFTLDPEGHLLQVNPTMAEYMGYGTPQEMMEVVRGPLWTLAASPEIHDGFLATLDADNHIRSFELEILRRDGTSLWISSSVRKTFKNGRHTGFMGMFENITERKALREQLQHAQKMESVGQLAAGIAHEINTPVQYIGDNVRFLKQTFEELVTLSREHTRILGNVQAVGVTPQLLEDISQASQSVDVDYLFKEIPQAIDQTLEGVSRVAALVGAMKEFSHPGTGKKVLLDLNRAIENTIIVARNEWKYVADVETDLEPDLPQVSCLPGEFNQVMLNMLVNAAHAIGDVAAAGGPEKGLIKIVTRSSATAVEIRIQDTGTGIPENVRSRIFDPFFTTKGIGKGTGQGLAIAWSVVVDKHHGSIEVESEPGHGTTFIIRLPYSEVHSSAMDEVAA